VPTPRIYAGISTRISRLVTWRTLLWLAPVAMGSALFDNAWGQTSYHIAGRLLTGFFILWIPIAIICIAFGPKEAEGQHNRPIAWVKAGLCSVLLLLSLIFLVVVEFRDWQP
jgi:hypothetical protein